MFYFFIHFWMAAPHNNRTVRSKCRQLFLTFNYKWDASVWCAHCIKSDCAICFVRGYRRILFESTLCTHWLSCCSNVRLTNVNSPKCEGLCCCVSGKWKPRDYYTAIRIITMRIMSNEFNHQTHTHTRRAHAIHVRHKWAPRFFTICITHKMPIVKAYCSLYLCQHGMFSLTYQVTRCKFTHKTQAIPKADIHTHTHTHRVV